MSSSSTLLKWLVLFSVALPLLAHALPSGADPSLAVHTTETDFGSGDMLGGFAVSQVGDGGLAVAPRAMGIDPWDELDALPQRLIKHGMSAAEGRLFVAGGVGSDGTEQSTVYRANIDADGTLGAWEQIGSLPIPLADHAVVAASGYLFILGGWDGQNVTSAVYGAPLNDGQLGDWASLTPLPVGLAEHTAVAANGYLIVVGGRDSDGKVQAAAYRAPINSDGSLGSWTEIPSLPQPLDSHAAVMAGSCLFVIGGWDGDERVSLVYRTFIGPGNPIPAWEELVDRRLPEERLDHSAVASHGQVFVIGGIGSGGYDESTVFQATVGADCTLGIWEPAQSLPNGVFDHAATTIQGNLYVTGGRNINLFKYDTVYNTGVIPNGTLGAWSELADSPLQAPLSAHAVALSQDHLFVIGGQSAVGVLSATHSTRVLDGGALADWRETTPLPLPLHEHASAAANDRLLVLGGHDGNMERDDLYAADILQDGTLGNWETLGCPLPQPLYGHAVATADPYLYVIGGRRGFDEQDTVYRIGVGENCTPQSWELQTSLPQPMWQHAAAVVGDHLFVSGGVSQHGGLVLDTVYRNTIGAGGHLGPWVELTDTPMPDALHRHAMVSSNGFLYVIGGHAGALGESYRVYRARVQADGTLDGWEELSDTPLLQALHSHAALSTDMVLFVLGGTHSYEPQTTVYSTSLYRAAAQAAFTHQFDLGSDQDIGILDWQARGEPEVALGVHYRIASESATDYGPWSEALFDPPIPIYNPGRYLQYQLLVDNPNGGVKMIDEISLTYGDVGDYVKVTDDNGAGVPGAEVYLNGQPLGTTGPRGILPSDDLEQGIQLGDELAVLSAITQTSTIREAHSTPDSEGVNWAYRTHLTNLETTALGVVHPYTVTQSGGQVIVLRHDSPLVLYNLLVSIEWDANVTYTQQVSDAVRLASDYLYDLSDGQMAFGRVQIYDNAEHWRDADIQISTKNIVHPHAYIGGITSKDRSHVIRVGRLWDGTSGNKGPWDDQPGYRTLGHEFGHYALHLYDEYFRYVFDQNGNVTDENPACCTIWKQALPEDDAVSASAMYNQYRTTELSAQGVPDLWGAPCEQTAQWQLNGESAWETLDRKYADSHSPARWHFTTPADRGGAVAGPGGLPTALPGWPSVEIHQSGSSPPLRELVVSDAQGLHCGALVDLHTSQRGQPVALDEGLTDQQGKIWIYGAQPGDTLYVISFDGGLAGSVSVSDATSYTLTMTAPTSLQTLAVPGLNPHLLLRPSSDGGALLLRLYGLGPDAILASIVTQSGASASQTTILAYSSTERAYIGSVDFSTPHMQQGTGMVQVLGVSGNSQGINLSTTYALQSVPRDLVNDLYSADGNLHVHLITDTLLVDAYAVLSPLNAIPTAPPEGWRIVGNAYDVRCSGAAPLTKPAVLKLHYDGELIRPPLSPLDLRLFWWNPANQTWQAVPEASLDEDQEALVARVTALGTYALLAPRDGHLDNNAFLPIILNWEP